MRSVLKATSYNTCSRFGCVFWLCATTALVASAGAGSASATGLDLKGSVWEKVAMVHDIDPLLLYSVSLVESRRKSGSQFVSPSVLVVRSPEGSKYFDDKQSAIAHLKQTVSTYRPWEIDVCAMQINLRWNGHRVKEWEQLFDLETCLRVGSEVLAIALSSVPGDLELGIGRFHQWGDEYLARQYGRRVISVWKALQSYRVLKVGS